MKQGASNFPFVTPLNLSNADFSTSGGSNWGLIVNGSGLTIGGLTLSTALNTGAFVMGTNAVSGSTLATALNSGTLMSGANAYAANFTGTVTCDDLYSAIASTSLADLSLRSISSQNTRWQTFGGFQEAVVAPSLSNAAYNYFSIGNEPIMVSPHQSYTERNVSWKDAMIEEIGAYSHRPAGWDGYNAQPIKPNAISDAIDFVRLLPDDVEIPRDLPVSDGNVSLVWRDKSRYGEISFPGDGTFFWYATNGEREEGDDDVPVAHGLPELLQEIIGFGLIASSVPPIPRYGGALLEAV